MNKVIITGFLFFICSALRSQDTKNDDIVPLSSSGTLAINDIRVNSGNVGRFEKFEITFHMTGEWENPFDHDQVKVDGHFRSPDGKEIVVPGFFYQEYYQKSNGELAPVAGPVWKVRFSPLLSGEYKFELVAKNNGREIKSPSRAFKSIDYNVHHGFVNISNVNPLYFEHSDGTPFFGVAMGKAGASPSHYESLYKKFAKSGGNFNRLFLTGGSINIEELNTTPERPDRGLGKMNLESSWNLDRIMELGEQLGIYHILTLTNQWTFHNRWDVHVFNKANGGILETKADYWTNEEAMKYFQRRLRYHVARWGYSTSLFSWDLWNEYSAAPGAEIDVAVQWHQRMARYLSSVDPFEHIIHTNDGSLNGRDAMHALPEMDIVSTNSYAVKNIANVAEVWTKKMTEKFKKPYLLTEFGPGHSTAGVGGYGGMDPERRMVHNGLWSPLMSGSAGTGVAWEGSWLDHPTFYTYIQGVSKFVEGIPFSKRQWKPVNVSSFNYVKPTSGSNYADVIIEGWPGNFRRSGNHDVFNIDKNGKVDHQESLNAILSGTPGRNGTSSITFKANYPADGEFVVYVSELRGTEPTPQLTVALDGKQKIQKDLLPLKTKNYHPTGYNQYYTLKVPAGSHTIQISNTGGGSFVTAFELKNYILHNGPELEVRGLQSDDYILLWLKSQKFTILHELMNISLQGQPEGQLGLQNVPDGTWIVEWLNTVDATFVKTEVVESRNRTLVLKTPAIDKSIAIRLRKL